MVSRVVAFSAGEFAPQLRGRADLQQFEIGAQFLENFTVNFGGGAKKRPGMEFVALVSEIGIDTGGVPTTGWSYNWDNNWSEND